MSTQHRPTNGAPLRRMGRDTSPLGAVRLLTSHSNDRVAVTAREYRVCLGLPDTRGKRTRPLSLRAGDPRRSRLEVIGAQGVTHGTWGPERGSDEIA